MPTVHAEESQGLSMPIVHAVESQEGLRSFIHPVAQTSKKINVIWVSSEE